MASAVDFLSAELLRQPACCGRAAALPSFCSLPGHYSQLSLPPVPGLPICSQAARLPDAQLLVLDGAYTSWLQQADEFLPALRSFLGQGG